jgi:dTDP-glucose 4,6-dehydratase
LTTLSNVEHALAGGKATFVYADIGRPASELRATLESAARGRKLDAIFHFASPGHARTPGADPLQTLVVNSVGTMALIDIACDHGGRFVFASTPVADEHALFAGQSNAYETMAWPAFYDEGKRFGEAAVAAGVVSRGLDGRIVRFFDCYGPRMPSASGRLVPTLIEAALEGRPLPIEGGGHEAQALTYVKDAISLLLCVSDNEEAGIDPVDIGSNDETSSEEIARTIADISGTPFRPSHAPGRTVYTPELVRKADLSHARGYGWHPATTLSDGLRQTFDWFASKRAVYA